MENKLSLPIEMVRERPEAGFLVYFGVKIFRAVMKFYCCLNFDADLGKLESKYFVEYQFDVLRCAVP